MEKFHYEKFHNGKILWRSFERWNRKIKGALWGAGYEKYMAPFGALDCFPAAFPAAITNKKSLP